MFACGVVAGVVYMTWWERPLPATDATESQRIAAAPAAVAPVAPEPAPVVSQPTPVVAEPVRRVPEPVPVRREPARVVGTSIRVNRIPAKPVPVRASAEQTLRDTERDDESSAEPESFRGALSIASTPQGAQVSLNGRVVGVTPLTLTNLPAGSRAVQVRLDGYNSWSSAVQIVADRKTSLTANLTRSPR